jgi:hypothetical protein
MTIILLLAVLLAASSPHCCAQQLTWELRMGERLLLSGTENGRTDTVRLPSPGPGRHPGIMLRFREKPSNLAWRYTLICTDNTGRILMERPCSAGNDSCSISFTELKAPGSRFLRLFLEQHPADPESSIRSRRTPLGILQLPEGT